jgi:hypothetical protein
MDDPPEGFPAGQTISGEDGSLFLRKRRFAMGQSGTISCLFCFSLGTIETGATKEGGPL